MRAECGPLHEYKEEGAGPGHEACSLTRSLFGARVKKEHTRSRNDNSQLFPLDLRLFSLLCLCINGLMGLQVSRPHSLSQSVHKDPLQSSGRGQKLAVVEASRCRDWVCQFGGSERRRDRCYCLLSLPRLLPCQVVPNPQRASVVRSLVLSHFQLHSPRLKPFNGPLSRELFRRLDGLLVHALAETFRLVEFVEVCLRLGDPCLSVQVFTRYQLCFDLRCSRRGHSCIEAVKLVVNGFADRCHIESAGC
mmetsp:Transcript_9676/g.18801  ORF Transcript_9676/g.18801 Transcript_9676/m.18801 type:complete len:249 (-) Transcript_9676:1265-2011(-)